MVGRILLFGVSGRGALRITPRPLHCKADELKIISIHLHTSVGGSLRMLIAEDGVTNH